MKYIVILLLTLVWVIPQLCHGQVKAGESVGATEAGEKAAVRMIEEAWSEALKARDRAAMESLLLENFISQGQTKEVRGKEKYLSSISSEGGDLGVPKVKNIHVRIYATDAAIATGRITFRSLAPGQARGTSYDYTHLYVKREGAWKIATENFDPLSSPGAK